MKYVLFYGLQSGFLIIATMLTGILPARQAEGMPAAAIAEEMAKLEFLRVNYCANPLHRIPMTFLDFFPVGLLVALVSALQFRNPGLLPATG